MVSNLIRFVNEFWFIKIKESESIEDLVRKDVNLNTNANSLLQKIKYHESIEVITNKNNI